MANVPASIRSEITEWVAPSGEGVRVDTHIESGYTVPPHYDSLICKVISYGDTREEATERMLRALGDMVCEGVSTTSEMHQAIMSSPEFRESRYDTGSIPGWEVEN